MTEAEKDRYILFLQKKVVARDQEHVEALTKILDLVEKLEHKWEEHMQVCTHVGKRF